MRERFGISKITNTATAAIKSAATPIKKSRDPGSAVIGTMRRGRFCGRRLIRIIGSLVSLCAHRQPDADQRLRGMRGEVRAIERRIDLDAAPRIGYFERQARAALDRAMQRCDLRA